MIERIKKTAGVFVCLACGMMGVSALGQGRVEVVGQRVNLRAAPQMAGEVVGQVSAPEQLVLQGDVTAPWVRVMPPEAIDLWVFASLLKGDQISVSKAQVRAGAGLNYTVVGTLSEGVKVQIRGKVGDWVKIAPTPETSVWITNCYVKTVAPLMPPASPAPAPEVKPIQPAPQPAPEVKPAKQPAPEPQKDTKAVASKPVEKPAPSVEAKRGETPAGSASRRTLLGSGTGTQGVGPARVPLSRLRPDADHSTTGSYTGILALSPTGSHPTRFRLVVFDANRKPQTVCYVLGNQRQLDSLKGTLFTIEGTIYWYRNTEKPTVYAQSILKHQNK